MDSAIIIALISAGIPSVATIVTAIIGEARGRGRAKEARELAERSAAKQSILQMILEDQFAWENLHKLPTNFENIHHEWDVYSANHGNSYVHKKVAEYDNWFTEVENSLKSK